MLDLVEDADAAGEAHGVHVVEAEVQQVLGSSGDTVPLAGDIVELYNKLLIRPPFVGRIFKGITASHVKTL